jgi:hypothetical protein
MKKTIALKIDVSKIDKSRLFKGQKGTYLDAVLFYDENSDQYGNNGMIVQSVSKEERAQGIKGAILGNGKDVGASPTTNQAPVMDSNFDKMSDDLPF